MHLTTYGHFYFRFNCLLRSTEEFQIILVCFINQLWNTLLQLHKNKDLKIIRQRASSLLSHPRMLKVLMRHGCDRTFGEADPVHTGHMTSGFLLSYKEENGIIKCRNFSELSASIKLLLGKQTALFTNCDIIRSYLYSENNLHSNYVFVDSPARNGHCVIQADPQTRNEATSSFLIMKYTFLGEDNFLNIIIFIATLKASLFSKAKHLSREPKKKKESY